MAGLEGDAMHMSPRLGSILFPFVLGGCASAAGSLLLQPVGDGSVTEGVYVNRTYAVTVGVPDTAGWMFVTDPTALDALERPPAVFHAENPSTRMGLMVMREDSRVRRSNEEYQAAVRTDLVALPDASVRELSLAPATVSSKPALIWMYAMRSSGLERVHVTTFLQRGTENFVLDVWTDEELYERRRDDIYSIVRTFDVVLPEQPDSVGADNPTDRDGTFAEAVVDRPPVRLSGTPLVYPAGLREAGVEGYVIITIVVGKDGHPEEETLVVTQSSHRGFEAAARAAILGSVYRPGTIRGQRVRVLIRQPVHFNLPGR